MRLLLAELLAGDPAEAPEAVRPPPLQELVEARELLLARRDDDLPARLGRNASFARRKRKGRLRPSSQSAALSDPGL